MVVVKGGRAELEEVPWAQDTVCKGGHAGACAGGLRTKATRSSRSKGEGHYRAR